MTKTAHEELVLLDEDSDPTVAVMNKALVEEVTDIVMNTVAGIFEIDLELEKCKKALYLLQPQKPGKLDLRFWTHKTLPGKHPQLFRWVLLRQGLQAPVRGVKQRRGVKSGKNPRQLNWSGVKLRHKAMTQWARRSKGFQDTHEFVVDVLRSMQGLLDIRSVLVERLSIIRRDEARWGAARRRKVAEIGRFLDQRMAGWERVSTELAKMREEEAVKARRLVAEANAASASRKWGVRK